MSSVATPGGLSLIARKVARAFGSRLGLMVPARTALELYTHELLTDDTMYDAFLAQGEAQGTGR